MADGCVNFLARSLDLTAGDKPIEGLWSNWRAAAPTVHVVPQQLTIGGVL